MKSVQIRSFFWTESRKIRTRKNSVFGHFCRNGSFLQRLDYFQHDMLLLAFFSTVVLIQSNFLYHQTKTFKKFRANQTNLVYFWILVKYLYLQATSLGLSVLTFRLSAFWYWNPIFTRYACSVVLPYGNS